MIADLLIALAIIAGLVIVLFAWSACILAGRADDADEQIMREIANGDAPPVVQTSPHDEIPSA